MSGHTHLFLDRAHNALHNHLTQDDLVGALQDVYDVPVVINGKTYAHLEEVDNALNSLENIKEQILFELRQQTPATVYYRQLSQEIEALAETIRRIDIFLERT